jgi:hypothetical protein
MIMLLRHVNDVVGNSIELLGTYSNAGNKIGAEEKEV